MKKKIIPIYLATILSAGCASIVARNVYPVHINSTPLGARISITNSTGIEVYEGVTPAVVNLKSSEGFFKRATYSVTFIKEGYEDVEAQIRSKLNGWYFGNILLGVVPGMLIVDPVTGAMYKIDNDYIMEPLTPFPSYSSGESALRIYELDEIPDSMKNHLVKISD